MGHPLINLKVFLETNIPIILVKLAIAIIFSKIMEWVQLLDSTSVVPEQFDGSKRSRNHLPEERN